MTTQHEALRDRRAGDEKIAACRTAVFLKDRVHRDDHDIVHRDDDEWGEADRQDPAYQPPVITAESDAYRHSLSEERFQHEGAACRLGEDCCRRGAGDTHVKTEDKYRIQDNI